MPDCRRVLRAISFPLFFTVIALFAWTGLRIALWREHQPQNATTGEVAAAFFAGLHMDVVCALCASGLMIGISAFVSTAVAVPVWLVLKPLRRSSWKRVWRPLFRIAVTTACAISVFLLIAEWYFFAEFESRFNTVAVDYLIYPHEVITNLRESYPVTQIIVVCAVGGGALAWTAFHFFSPQWSRLGARGRWLLTGGWAGAAVLGLLSVKSSETAFSTSRIINELANNGWNSAVRAAWTRNLDYAAFYPVMDRTEAFRRARRLLAEPGVTFAGPAVPPAPAPDRTGQVDETAGEQWLDIARASLQRRIPGDAARPRLNVCILLEESLGSEFWGALGRTKKNGKPDTLTPEMDRVATQDSFLFTNFFADGNRTIRGFEAVFSSFPPLPGDSILARDRTDGVETIATVLKRDEYRTLFVYGGRGTFDYVKSYTLANGWDRLIEQSDFASPVHTTAWGVCDEDLYHRGIDEMRALHDSGKPFLVAFMTVSNHLPFTYPEGRIKEDPRARSRKHAVKYSDWALGDFFRRVKREKFWKDTIFAVVADHGARVYGSQTIPMKSYEIPLVITGPAVVKEARRVNTLGCQLDVAPTLLGLIGRPYDSLFFGHDLLKTDADSRSRCLMHHNRSIAVFRDARQVVFGLNRTIELWRGDPHHGAMAPGVDIDETFRELEMDGIALFQVADELYMHHRFHTLPRSDSPEATPGSPTRVAIRPPGG